MSAQTPAAPDPSVRDPRTLPGREETPERRGGLAVVGVVVGVALGLATLLAQPGALGSAGTGPDPASVGAVEPTGRTTRVEVTAAGMTFSPSRIEVPAGDRLVLTLVNADDQRHDLVLASGAESGMVAPGGRAELDAGVVTADLAGWCSLPGHRQMGMALEVVAKDAADSTSAASAPGSVHPDHDTAMTSEGAPSMAQLVAAAADLPAAPAELPPLTDETEHRVTFTVTEKQDTIVPGRSRTVWTYNGTSPGPVLHGRVGDTFVITLVNDGTMGHSIDFHAGELAPDRPMRTIEPGQRLEYTFTADRSGAWMYHCSTMPMTQHIANGMFGVVVIEPPDLEPVAHQFVLVQSDQFLGADSDGADPTKVSAGTPDLVTFNGRAFQYDAHPLHARVGERVRIWLLAAGSSSSLSFHVVGAQFDTVWKEGAYTVWHGSSSDNHTAGATGAQTLGLLAAEGGFVELVTHEAGHYAFVNHQMDLAGKGAHGLLEVAG